MVKEIQMRSKDNGNPALHMRVANHDAFVARFNFKMHRRKLQKTKKQIASILFVQRIVREEKK